MKQLWSSRFSAWAAKSSSWGAFLKEQIDAVELAERSGAVLLQLRRQPGISDLPAAGDRVANAILVEGLQRRYPGDAVLSEEAPDDAARLRSERVWIVDPLDGSREFGEEGRSDWAVHVAFLYRGELAAGAVALPARDLTLSTLRANTTSAAPSPRLRILVSRSRPPDIAFDVAQKLGAEVRTMGSAGAKTAAVLLSEAEAYLHGGGLHEWDIAAPAAVALAAGLHVSRLDGRPLQFNQPDPWLGDVLVCRPRQAPALLAAVRQVAAAG